MKLVFDTNILINHLRGGDVWDDILDKIDEDTKIYLPSIVMFELFSGQSSKNKKNFNKIMKLVKCFDLVDLDSEIAAKAGELYRDVSKSLEVSDYIVAATALHLKAEVVTLNRKHFRLIPELEVFEFE
jgi:predicted nucleic acid-binding protein